MEERRAREQEYGGVHQFPGGEVEKCNLVVRPADIFSTLLIDFYRGRSPSFLTGAGNVCARRVGWEALFHPDR